MLHKPRLCFSALGGVETLTAIATGIRSTVLLPAKALGGKGGCALPAPAQGIQITNKDMRMKSRQAVSRGRLFRLECIALGMALATTGDREKVLQALGGESLQSELVQDCLKAIETRRPEDIAKLQSVFKGWGVSVSDSVTDSVIREIEIRNSNRRIREAMDRISKSVDSDISSAIDELNVSLIDHQSVTNKYQVDPKSEGDLF